VNSFQIIEIIKNSLSIKKIKRISFRNDINGLRAIAVLGVVLYHLDINYFGGGYLGVDIFFVISGYLISNIIFSELNRENFSPEELFCNSFKQYECVGAFEGSIFYYDTNHLTKTGAKLVGDEVIYILNEED